MTRVLICDDQQVVRTGLRAILGTVAQIEVIGMARDGAEALELAERDRPDVVLMDLKMPNMDGVQATREIRRRLPGVRVLVLTTFDADEWVFEAIRSGASGYLLKDSTREALVEAIEGTAAGRTHIDPQVAGRLFAHVTQAASAPPSPLLAALTEREREILGFLGRGASNAGIAQALDITEGTVRNHVSAILGKLEVADRTQAALIAQRCGLSG